MAPVLPSSDAQSTSSMTLLCPIRSQRGQVARVRHRPAFCASSAHVPQRKDYALRATWGDFTFFLNCLWIASNASLIVTPFRLRAVTSSPNGKCRSIFLTGGSVRNFLSTSFSSMVPGEVLRRLVNQVSHAHRGHTKRLSATTSSTTAFGVRSCVSPVQSLSLFCYLQFLTLLFYRFVSLAFLGYGWQNRSLVNTIGARFQLT